MVGGGVVKMLFPALTLFPKPGALRTPETRA